MFEGLEPCVKGSWLPGHAISVFRAFAEVWAHSALWVDGISFEVFF